MLRLFVKPAQWHRGFTLMEVMIVVAIVGILASIAYPSYLDYVRKARRADAVDAILRVQMAQEKYRANNLTYATLPQLASYGVTTSSVETYYTLAVSGNTATNYTISATAQGAQANDREGSQSCTTLSFALAAGVETKSPAACWKK